MPTYAYGCQNCGSEFERVQKFTDKPVSKCPVCGKGPVRRLVQPAAIVFKGSGWYATDHRSPSGNGTSKGEKADKTETAEKADKAETSVSKSNGNTKPAKKESKAPSGHE